MPIDFDNNDMIIGTPGNEYKQSYADTCAIKSQQIILNEFGIPVTEEQLIKYSYHHGWYNGDGTSFEDLGNLLEDGGISCHKQYNANVFNLVAELAQGHKVIVGLDADELWGDRITAWLNDFYYGETPNHALIVSGVDTSDPNNVQILVTDPGNGDHNKAYPLEQFMDAWADAQCYMVATDIPAPSSLPQMDNFDFITGHLPYIGGMDYSSFLFFNDFSYALPIYATTDRGFISPMSSLVDAYFDVASNDVEFHDIFHNYEFNDYIDFGIANDSLSNTYNSGLEHINFSPDHTWDIYAHDHNYNGFNNELYGDFLHDSINYFDTVGDLDSSLYCEQQLMILDYCDSCDIDFYDTFFS